MFRVWSVQIDGFIVKSSEIMDPPTVVSESRDIIQPENLDLDPTYMAELQLASQETAEGHLTIQGELSKFKSFGVKYLEWLQNSKFGKDDSNHTIVVKFYEDHAATFPKLSKLEFLN